MQVSQLQSWPNVVHPPNQQHFHTQQSPTRMRITVIGGILAKLFADLSQRAVTVHKLASPRDRLKDRTHEGSSAGRFTASESDEGSVVTTVRMRPLHHTFYLTFSVLRSPVWMQSIRCQRQWTSRRSLLLGFASFLVDFRTFMMGPYETQLYLGVRYTSLSSVSVLVSAT